MNQYKRALKYAGFGWRYFLSMKLERMATVHARRGKIAHVPENILAQQME